MFRICIFLLFGSFQMLAQRQLVVIKNDRVVQRIHEGQTFQYQTKNSKKVFKQFLVESDAFNFVTNLDSLKINDIYKISVGRRNTFFSLFGQAMITAGVGYIFLDEINRLIILHESGAPDHQVAKQSACIVGIGIPLRFMKKRWDKPGFKNVQMRSIDYKSRFYREK
jgi:hypothetical protein